MGLILCGGKSKDSQKGLREFGESNFAETISKVLSEFVEESIFSVNEIQFPEYLQRFQNSEIIIDSYKLGEPFAGVLSAYSAFRIFNFIAIPCEMVENTRELIQTLLDEYKKDPRHEFYIFKQGDKIYPYCGIYTSRGIAKIHNYYNEGQNLIPADSILESLDTKFIPIEEKVQISSALESRKIQWTSGCFF